MEKLLNLGPKSSLWLKEIGVHSKVDFMKRGPRTVYNQLLAKGHRPNKNLWYSLVGAYVNITWQEAREELEQGIIKF